MMKLSTKKGRDHRDVWVFFVTYELLEEIPGMATNDLTAVTVKSNRTAFIPALDANHARSMVRNAHNGTRVAFSKVEKVGGWNAHWVN